MLPKDPETLHRLHDFRGPSCHIRSDPSSLCHERRDDRGADERETAMSFLFALLQLVSFGFADLEPAERPTLAVSTTERSDLLERPIVTPCTGNGCR